MEKELIQLVSEILDIPSSKLTLDKGPQSVTEWDSLAQVTIISAVEEKYNITLSMPEILAIKSINDLKDLIEKYTN